MTACPSGETLKSFLAEELSPAKVAEIETHIDNCDRCSNSLAQMSANSTQILLVNIPTQTGADRVGEPIDPEFLTRLKQRHSASADSSHSRRHVDDTNQDSTAPVARSPIINGYEVFEEIGRGGMGVVYKARHLGLKRLVAVKMLLGSRFESDETRRRFHREAQAIGRLQHPHIVQVYDFGETEAGPYFSLELLDGGSLSRKLDGTPWNPDAAAGFMERLAWAIQYAHEQGIIHRDLKPANILLQRGTAERRNGDPDRTSDSAPNLHASQFVAKVGDFGLAKYIDDDRSHTANGTILGTPSYLAPEQTDFNSANIGPATDVYGLGAVLYELLTGWPPFKGNSIMTTLLLVAHQEPVRPSRLGIRIPRDLETICLKCLEKSPSKRYESAGLLAEDLHRFLARKPVLARPVGWTETVWRWCYRKPFTASLLATIAIVTLVGFAATALALRSAAEGWNRAQTALDGEIASGRRLSEQTTKTENALYVQKLSLAHHEWLRFNVSRANEMLEECPVESRSWEWKYLHRLCNDEVLLLKNHNNQVHGVCFSHDGQRIATSTGIWPVNVLRTAAPDPGEACVWDAVTGSELFRLKQHTGAVMGVTFSADDRFIATASFDQTARIWDATTGSELFVFKSANGSWVHSVAFSPDSNRLAMSSAGAVQIHDTANGNELLQLHGHKGSVHSIAFTPDGNRLITGGWDGKVKIWDVNPGRTGTVDTPLRTIDGPKDVRSVAVSPNGERIAAGGYDSVVKVFDLETGTEIVSQRSHKANIESVAFSPDGRTVVSSDSEGRVLLWDALTTGHQHVIRGHVGGVFGTAFRSDGRYLATASSDRTVKIWDITTEQEFRELVPKDGFLRQMNFSHDSKSLAASGSVTSRGQQTTARIWDLAERQSAYVVKGHTEGVTSTAFTPDGRYLITGSADRTVKIWLLESGKNIATLTGHTDAVTTVTSSPDGVWIASGSTDKTARIWQKESLNLDTAALVPAMNSFLPKALTAALPARVEHAPKLTLSGHSSGITSIAFDPNSRWLAVGGHDGSIRVTSVADGKELLALTVTPGPVTSLSFDRDGRHLAASVGNIHPAVWEIAETANGSLMASSARFFRGHSYEVLSVAFSADGRRLASANIDDAVRLWDVESGYETIALSVPQKCQTSIAFSPDGKTLAAGGNGILLWETERPDRNTPKWIEAWHRSECDRATADGEWYATVFHLTRLLDLHPESKGLYRELAEARMYMEKWSLAAADFSEFLRQDPSNPDSQYRHAAVSLLAGDEARFLGVCQTITELYGATDNEINSYYVARICTLMPREIKDLAVPFRLMERSRNTGPKPGTAFFSSMEHAIAMTQYRMGNFEKCIHHARVSMENKPLWIAREINRFVIALALNQLGRSEEARNEFNAAIKWMDEATKLSRDQHVAALGQHPADWLTMLILRREAENTLGISH